MLWWNIGSIITLTLLISSSIASDEVGKQLQIIEVRMGSNDGDGMDGGFLRNQNWGGGRFRFTFRTSDDRECHTGNLNSDEDNWEVGEFNYFVGRQIGNCAGFDMSNPNMTLTVRHAGKEVLEMCNVFQTYSRCLKITEKVSFNIASEASYILSGQKLIKNAKNGPFWRVFENLKLAVKQCYQTGQF